MATAQTDRSHKKYEPFDPTRYAMVGGLSDAECEAIRGKPARSDLDQLFLTVPRLVVPLLAVADHGGVSYATRKLAIGRILYATSTDRSPYWNWPKSTWLKIINGKGQSRPYLTALAYHLGGFRDFNEIAKFRHSSRYAATIFGRAIVNVEHARLASTLRGLGYSGRHLELFLTSVLGSLMLENGDPRLETFTTALLQRGQANRNLSIARAVGKVSAGLAAMQIIEQPLRMRNYVGWRDRSTEGVAPEWAAWCLRWRDTTTLRPSTRDLITASFFA